MKILFFAFPAKLDFLKSVLISSNGHSCYSSMPPTQHWREFSLLNPGGFGEELIGPNGVMEKHPTWAPAATARQSRNATKTLCQHKKRHGYSIVCGVRAIIVVPEGTSLKEAKRMWHEAFPDRYVLRDPRKKGAIVMSVYTAKAAANLSAELSDVAAREGESRLLPRCMYRTESTAIRAYAIKQGRWEGTILCLDSDGAGPGSSYDKKVQDGLVNFRGNGTNKAARAAAVQDSRIASACSKRTNGSIVVEASAVLEAIRPLPLNDEEKEALQNQKKLSVGGGGSANHDGSCVAAVSRGALKMYEARDKDKHGLVGSFSWGNRCIATITSLTEVEQGWMVAKPISTMMPHGLWELNPTGGAKSHRVVGQPCRLSAATYGSRGSMISRSSQGYNTKSVEDRSRRLALIFTDRVRNHQRLVGPRNAEDSQMSGFDSLNDGESWRKGKKMLFKGMESRFAAQLQIARDVTLQTWKVIDDVTIAMAPEDENIPPNCIVFSACRSTANGKGAFTGGGDRRDEAPGGTAGERKPGQYWNAMLPYRKRYYSDARCQSYRNNHAKRIAAEAGAAVKRLGLPIYIAIYENGHLRYFRLFSDFVDYLCYYDLKVWQSIVRHPQHRWPQPIQP